MNRTLLLAVLAAGCTGDVGPCTPAPRWQLAVGNNLDLRMLPDATMLLVDDGQVKRVGADGQPLAAVALAASNGGPKVGSDDTGALVVAICNFDSTGTVTLYDAAFAPQRSFTLPSCAGAIARGPAGQVAYTLGLTTTTMMVHALDPGGTELWAAPLDGRLDYAPNGDVVVYGYQPPQYMRRVELAAASGAIVADAQLPLDTTGIGNIPTFTHDGSYLVLTYDRLDAVGVTRRDGTGADVWTRPLHSLVETPVLASNGDVVLRSEIRTRMVRLDGTSGATLASTPDCIEARLAGATATSYLLYVPFAGTLASYAGP